MTEILISATISVLLVIIEAIGMMLSKWTLAKRYSEPAVHEAEARAALQFTAAELQDGQDPVTALAEHLRAASDKARSDHLKQSLVGIIPGPELCFLALTIVASLFLAFNYSNDQLRQAISPLLASTRSAFPILLGVVLLDLIMWIGVLIWREAIVMGIQQRFLKVSITLIMAVGEK